MVCLSCKQKISSKKYNWRKHLKLLSRSHVSMTSKACWIILSKKSCWRLLRPRSSLNVMPCWPLNWNWRNTCWRQKWDKSRSRAFVKAFSVAANTNFVLQWNKLGETYFWSSFITIKRNGLLILKTVRFDDLQLNKRLCRQILRKTDNEIEIDNMSFFDDCGPPGWCT